MFSSNLDAVSSNGGWNTIGLGGCSDGDNENTLFQVDSSNAGGYFHNRAECIGQNGWGSFGNCSIDNNVGGAKIFVR